MAGNPHSRRSVAIDAQGRAALPRRLVRLRRTSAGIELYYPALRLPQIAVLLGLFGGLAFALAALGANALLTSALASTAGAITAVLLGVFLAAFALFGAVLLIQALCMLAHTLRVEVDEKGITAAAFLLGLPLPVKHLARDDIAAIEPRIPARHQSPLSRDAVYQLVACNAARTRRVIVAESLRGETLMTQVKSVIEDALGLVAARQEAWTPASPGGESTQPPPSETMRP